MDKVILVISILVFVWLSIRAWHSSTMLSTCFYSALLSIITYCHIISCDNTTNPFILLVTVSELITTFVIVVCCLVCYYSFINKSNCDFVEHLDLKTLMSCYKVASKNFYKDANYRYFYKTNNKTVLLPMNIFKAYIFDIFTKYIDKHNTSNSIVVDDVLKQLEETKKSLDIEIDNAQQQIIGCANEFEEIINKYHNK